MPARGVRRRRPAGVRRRTVTATVVLVVALLAGVVAFADQLRHPASGAGRVADSDILVDPRDETDCPDIDEVDRPGGVLTPPEEPLMATSEDLLRCADRYHGRRVRYRGEAVGEVLERGARAWVQLNDDVYHTPGGTLPHRRDYAGANSGVGARLPRDGAQEIASVGGPHRRGDTIMVVGRFYRALPDTADSMAIVVERVERIRAGGSIDDPLLADRRLAALALGVVAAIMVVGERVVTRRR